MLHRGQPGGGPRIVAYSDSSSDGGADTAAVDMDDSLESLDSLDNGRGDGADGEYASSSYSPRGHGGQSKRRGGGAGDGGGAAHTFAHTFTSGSSASASASAAGLAAPTQGFDDFSQGFAQRLYAEKKTDGGVWRRRGIVP